VLVQVVYKSAIGLFIVISLFTINVPTRAVSDTSSLINGVDLSWLPDVEKAGGKFYSRSGKSQPPLRILQHQGLGIGRVRVWVNKSKGQASLKRAIELGKRLQSKGMRIMVDFHLSDNWADPSNQRIPTTWPQSDAITLKVELVNYLKTCIEQFQSKGVTLDIIQIGNEIGNGFLWPAARIDSNQAEQWLSFVTLYNAAEIAVREQSPNSKILLHLHNGGDAEWIRWWWSLAMQYGIKEPDYVGLSYYPNWHGDLSQLQKSLDLLKSENQFVWIVETAYPWTSEFFGNDVINPYQARLSGYGLSPKGQAKFISQLNQMMMRLDGHGVGIIWWEGLAIDVGKHGKKFKSGMQNSTLFDNDGLVLPALKLLGEG